MKWSKLGGSRVRIEMQEEQKNIYALQYDNYSANGKKCGEKKRVWCVNIKWDDIADLLLQVVFFPLSWSALKDSTQQEKKKNTTLASITWTISYYLAATILTWARCLCHTSSFCGLFFSFLSLLGSLTHFGSPLEQFDRLICNQLFYNLAARWRAVFCVFRVPCVLGILFMDQRNSIAATHQHNHHVKTDTYNLWYSFLLKCTLFYLLPFAFCIFVSS